MRNTTKGCEIDLDRMGFKKDHASTEQDYSVC